MFEDCKSLEVVPDLPDGVYNCDGMFEGCSSLKKAPVIPEGVEKCVQMFDGCVSLEEEPVIPESAKQKEKKVDIRDLPPMEAMPMDLF
jgi:hypothetical protein